MRAESTTPAAVVIDTSPPVLTASAPEQSLPIESASASASLSISDVSTPVRRGGRGTKHDSARDRKVAQPHPTPRLPNRLPLDSGNVASSVPCVESIQMDVQPRSERRWSPNYICGSVLLVLLAIVMMVAVVLVTTSGSLSAMSTAANANATLPPPRRASLDETLEYLVTWNISRRSDLVQPGTPQYQALHWLAEQDEANLAIPTRTTTSSSSSPQPHAAYMYVVRYVMAVNFFAWTGEQWLTKVNFLSNAYVCSWNGFSYAKDNHNGMEVGGLLCDPNTGLPVVLDLELNNLAGTIPTENGLLTTLRSLDLEFNDNLRGSIPTELCQLGPNLRTLTLRHNSFTGSIPECFREFQQLETLLLSHNQFSGELSRELCNLKQIQYVDLRTNRFEGRLPECLPSWSQLRWIDVSFNRFTGPLPLGLQQLKNSLHVFLAHDNLLTGTIPWMDIIQLTQLEFLYLSNNVLEGALPDDISALSHMKALLLSNNQLHGPLPKGFAQMTDLQFLRLSDNEFSGEIPSEFAALGATLIELYMDDNLFHGNPIPILNNLTRLEHLFLENNGFEGELDETFLAQSSVLATIDLSTNYFTSSRFSIPPQLLQIPTLMVLDLSNLQLRGALPNDIQQNSMLHYLSLRRNQVYGTIPTTIKNLERMVHLDLSNNLLSGPLPGELFQFHRLMHLIVSNNPQLETGTIPPALNGLTQITELALRNTNRVGSLPALEGFNVLQLLDLGKNNWTGSIPGSYARLPRLRYLLLDQTDISGEIPVLAQTRGLEFVLLDGTNLTGDLSTICSLPAFVTNTSRSMEQVLAVADCADVDQDTNARPIYCPCCYCCSKLERGCTDPVVQGLDWTWENGYAGAVRDFGLNLSQFVEPQSGL